MKNRILIGLIPLAFTKIIAKGSGIPEFDTNHYSSVNGITVEQNDWNAGVVEFKILDRVGTIVYKIKISNQEIGMKKFVTTGLADGNYTIQWMDDLALISQGVKIENSIPIMQKKSYKVVYKPVINVEGNQLNISMLSLKEEAKIQLFDPLGSKIFDERTSNEDSYQRKLKVLDPVDGYYVLSTEYKGQTFREYISLKKK